MAATSTRIDINNLWARIIPDLRDASTLLLAEVQALHGRLLTMGTVRSTSTVVRAPTPTTPAAPLLTSAVDDKPPITDPSVSPTSDAPTDREAPTLDAQTRPSHRFDSTWYHNASN
jgi:hypothetical protein